MEKIPSLLRLSVQSSAADLCGRIFGRLDHPKNRLRVRSAHRTQRMYSILRETCVWNPMQEMTITSPYVDSRFDSNTWALGNPYARADFNPPVLRILPQCAAAEKESSPCRDALLS
jgi:hypothetical protein